MGLGVGPVEADSQGVDARLLRPLERGPRGQRRGRGGQRDLQPARRGVADQLEQVGPLQRVAAGEHDRRPPRKRGRLVQQGLRQLRRQLLRVRMLLGRGPAVLAHQVAGLRDLVVEHQRIAAEILGRVEGWVHKETEENGLSSRVGRLRSSVLAPSPKTKGPRPRTKRHKSTSSKGRPTVGRSQPCPLQGRGPRAAGAADHFAVKHRVVAEPGRHVRAHRSQCYHHEQDRQAVIPEPRHQARSGRAWPGSSVPGPGGTTGAARRTRRRPGRSPCPPSNRASPGAASAARRRRAPQKDAHCGQMGRAQGDIPGRALTLQGLGSR